MFTVICVASAFKYCAFCVCGRSRFCGFKNVSFLLFNRCLLVVFVVVFVRFLNLEKLCL